MKRLTSRAQLVGIGMLVAVVTLPLGATNASAAPTVTTTPPGRWVRGACGDLVNWSDKIGEAEAGLTGVVAAVDNGTPVKKAKARTVKLAEKGAAASAVLVKHTSGLGVPRVKGGKTTASDYRSAVRDIGKAWAVALAKAKRLPSRGRTAFTKKVTAMIDQLYAEYQDVGNPLEPIKANAALAPTVANTDTCQLVEIAYAPSAEPTGYQPGDCIDAPYGVVRCTQPHDGEVLLVGTYPGAADTPYPGEPAFEHWVDTNCVPAFTGYVGIPLERSRYDMSWYDPTPETWTAGDREVVCLVTNPDSSHITGSVRNSAT